MVTNVASQKGLKVLGRIGKMLVFISVASQKGLKVKNFIPPTSSIVMRCIPKGIESDVVKVGVKL